MPEGNAPINVAGLTRFERFSFGLVRLVNEHFKLLASIYQRQLLARFYELLVGRLLRIRGLEHPMALPKDSPFILVTNHHTFFDLFTVSLANHSRGRVVRRVYYPVRATFFYESFLGFLVSVFIGGFAMYPPIFRDRKKLAFNRWSMDESARLLSTKAPMVGIHPEGTRNKGDPYTLLPAQPGAGRVAMRARVPVIPAFVVGLTNDLWSLFKRNWSKNGAPVYVIFGPPIDLEDLYAEGDRPPTHKRIADRMRDAISRLGEEQRRWEHDENVSRSHQSPDREPRSA